MKRRYVILVLMALWAIVPGCAGTGLREDGSPIFGPRAWADPPAPPQRQVMLTANTSNAPTDPAAPRQGLAKFFPGLNRSQTPAEAPPLATASAAPKARYRPTWFGLRPPKETSVPQTYMTDAREQLNRSGASPTSLPVALQVPTDRPSADRMVTPTNAETPSDKSNSPPSNPLESPVTASTSPATLDFGGKPARPGEDEVNPLPPAAEPTSPAAVADRMPQVPSVDPLDQPSTDRPAPKAVVYDDAAPDMQTVKVSVATAEPPAQGEPSKPAQPAAQVTETSKMAPPTNPVYASPQGPAPKPVVHVKPTAQVKPSPQEETAKSWKRPCLRRLVRKVCHLGEFADPPTTAPH